MAYTPCLKCHVHNKLTGLRGGGGVGMVSLVCITPVGNVLMRLGCQGKGTEDFCRHTVTFFKPGNHHPESHTCAW